MGADLMHVDVRERARALLAAGPIALVGVSRHERDFSRAVLRELRRRGHRVLPVNPALAEVDGLPCHPRVSAIVPPPAAALIMTPPAATAAVVRDCLAVGVTRLWLHRGGGRGAATPEAIAACRAAGVEPVTDLCPFMAFPDAGWLHRVHGRFRARRLARRA